MCMANDREEAIELLRSTHPKHASMYEGIIKCGKMAADTRV